MDWLPRARVTAAFTAALLTAGLSCSCGSSSRNSTVNSGGLQHPIANHISVGAAVVGGRRVVITGGLFASGDKVFSTESRPGA
jgi:hypothetical protein